jgi:hypothetical protein
MTHRITAAGVASSFVLISACGGDAPQIDVTADGGAGTSTVDGGGVSSRVDGSVSGTTDSGSSGNNGDAGPSTGQDSGSTGTTCGTCPTGFSCSAGGTVCKSPGGIPHFGHAYVLLMENQSQSAIEGSKSAPYINSLLKAQARTSSYSAVATPSLPNYIALTSGDTQGITCDCKATGASSTCGSICPTGDCNCNKPVEHLGQQLDAKGLTWRAYGEDMGTPCNTVDTGNYAPRHVPFVYYDELRNDAARCKQHVVDMTSFAADLGQYAFSFLTPNLCNDMHTGCGAMPQDVIKQGDDWLKAHVPAIVTAPGFGADSILFILWDEGGFFASQTVGLIAISPLVKAPFTSPVAYDHYSLLATIEEGLGLPKLGKAKTAAVMKDLFK